MNDSVHRGVDPYAGINPTLGYYIFQAIFLTLVMIITIFGNVTVCYVVYRTRSITTVTGMCITSLALADLLRGGLILPFVIMASATSGSWQLSNTACALLGMGYTMFGSASVMTLAAVSVDRYFAILKPLLYTTIVTTTRAAIFLCLIWSVSFIVSVLPIIGWSEYIFLPWNTVCIANWSDYKSYGYFYLTVSFFIPFSILVFCYYKIFIVARQQSRRVMCVEMTSTQAFQSQNGLLKSRQKPRIVMRKEKKAALTLFAVMGVFILCVTPYCIIHLAYAYRKTQSLLVAIGITSMLSFLNSAANPLIYGILNRKFRRVFVEVLRCKYCPRPGGSRPQAVTSTGGYASDVYTNAGASKRHQPMIPRDSGYTTSTSRTRAQNIFSISVFATTANTMASIGTNFNDLSKLAVGMVPVPIIDDFSEVSSYGIMHYRTKPSTPSSQSKGKCFKIKELNETDSKHDPEENRDKCESTSNVLCKNNNKDCKDMESAL